MLEQQREQLSSLMDDYCDDKEFIHLVEDSEELKTCWQRYHLVRDVMQGKSYHNVLSFDVSQNVIQAISSEALFEQTAINHSSSHHHTNIMWIKAKDLLGKLGQVGLAACVTFGIITGIQYQQQGTDETRIPVLNTVPIGVNVSPVGGVLIEQNEMKEVQDVMTQEQYDKVRLLIQNYELQKRLSVQ